MGNVTPLQAISTIWQTKGTRMSRSQAALSCLAVALLSGSSLLPCARAQTLEPLSSHPSTAIRLAAADSGRPSKPQASSALEVSRTPQSISVPKLPSAEPLPATVPWVQSSVLPYTVH